jgi:perosamine synthetase
MLTFLAIDLSKEDEVIVPAFGFMAAANVVKQLGAKVRFADVDPKSWCVTSNSISNLINESTKAIVITHTYGNHGEIFEIKRMLAQFPNITLIEDSAEALGSMVDFQKLGTIGNFGTYSFHATKLVTTGEGGAVVWDNEFYSEKMSLLVSHGLDRKRHYEHKLAGNNFRMSNINAALGISQFLRIDEFIRERKRVDKTYRKYFSEFNGKELFKFQALASEYVVPWSFPILTPIKEREELHEVVKEYASHNIEIRPSFATPNFLNYFKNSDTKDYPISFQLSNSVISLPSYPYLEDESISKIVMTSINIFKNYL